MKIFSNKTFQFDHPSGALEPVIVQNGSFTPVPDWVEDSAMYKLAFADGSITVINNKGDELAAETGNKSEETIEKERKSSEAKAAVAAAETEPNRDNVDLAHDLVIELPNGTQKTSLIKKIAAIETLLADQPKE